MWDLLRQITYYSCWAIGNWFLLIFIWMLGAATSHSLLKFQLRCTVASVLQIITVTTSNIFLWRVKADTKFRKKNSELAITALNSPNIFVSRQYNFLQLTRMAAIPVNLKKKTYQCHELLSFGYFSPFAV